jgi:hypothetical protein
LNENHSVLLRPLKNNLTYRRHREGSHAQQANTAPSSALFADGEKTRMSSSEDRYYIGSAVTPLDTDENRNRLIQRLRQYLEVRNLSVLVGNGSSIPLGAPLIGNTGAIVSELDQTRHRLTDPDQHQRARVLLEHLLKSKPEIGIESLLTVLVNLQCNDALLGAEQSIDGAKVTVKDARSCTL